VAAAWAAWISKSYLPVALIGASAKAGAFFFANGVFLQAHAAKLKLRRDLFDRRQFGFKLLALAATLGCLCGGD
jgi:hypothetical protein